jgi:hypothetical protein
MNRGDSNNVYYSKTILKVSRTVKACLKSVTKTPTCLCIIKGFIACTLH